MSKEKGLEEAYREGWNARDQYNGRLLSWESDEWSVSDFKQSDAYKAQQAIDAEADRITAALALLDSPKPGMVVTLSTGEAWTYSLDPKPSSGDTWSSNRGDEVYIATYAFIDLLRAAIRDGGTLTMPSSMAEEDDWIMNAAEGEMNADVAAGSLTMPGEME